MNTKLKAKYLQLLLKNNKTQNVGFTLIEILVAIIIIGILSAIALPSFLNQTTKASQTEARTNVGVMNRAQQVYYFDNQLFADDTGTPAVEKLGIGIEPSTFNYTYTAVIIADGIANKATAKKNNIKGYAGGVFTSAEHTQALLCEAEFAGITPVNEPTSATTCGIGSTMMQ